MGLLDKAFKISEKNPENWRSVRNPGEIFILPFINKS